MEWPEKFERLDIKAPMVLSGPVMFPEWSSPRIEQETLVYVPDGAHVLLKGCWGGKWEFAVYWTLEEAKKALEDWKTMTNPPKGWYVYDNIPRGRYTFAWGGFGLAYWNGSCWKARIWESGCHMSDNANWGKVVVEGDWHPREKDYDDLTIISLSSLRRYFEKYPKFRAWANKLSLPGSETNVNQWEWPESLKEE